MQILRSQNRSQQERHWLGRNFAITVLAIGCAVMTLVSVQQARTIDSQRNLIRELYQDSIQLGAMRMQRRPAQHLQ